MIRGQTQGSAATANSTKRKHNPVFGIEPHPQIVRTHADDEIAGIQEKGKIIPHLLRPVVADLARNAAIGDPQPQRQTKNCG